MRRPKHPKITTTGKYVTEARQDKYWTKWAEKRQERRCPWGLGGSPGHYLDNEGQCFDCLSSSEQKK